MRLGFTNQIFHGRNRYQRLISGHSAHAIRPLDQGLRNHAEKIDRHLHANLLLLMRGENVDHAINCLNSVRGMQGAEDKMTRFRGCDRQLDRLQVAHFADQNHVRVFSERRNEAH